VLKKKAKAQAKLGDTKHPEGKKAHKKRPAQFYKFMLPVFFFLAGRPGMY
jgi:hypothetical protein